MSKRRKDNASPPKVIRAKNRSAQERPNVPNTMPSKYIERQNADVPRKPPSVEERNAKAHGPDFQVTIADLVPLEHCLSIHNLWAIELDEVARAGTPIPTIDVIRINHLWIIVDGTHRTYRQKYLGRKTVLAKELLREITREHLDAFHSNLHQRGLVNLDVLENFEYLNRIRQMAGLPPDSLLGEVAEGLDIDEP